jgi:hypothetical protein
MRAILAAASAIALLFVVAVAPVAAFDLIGCELTVSSADDTGQPLDTASGPGAGGTLADPFDVHPLGTVHYDGHTNSVIKNHTWHVDVYGVPILTGGHDNSGGDTEGSGDISVAQYAADRLAGLYFVSGTLVGEGGSCDGSGWVRLVNDPVGTIPWLLGIALAAIGLLTLALATPGWRASTVVTSTSTGVPPR